MRLVFILILNLTEGFLIAQENKFSFGLIYQALIYENYSKSDWNNKPQSYPNNPNNFNGKSFGVEMEKPLNETFGIKFDAIYSFQDQKHKILSASETDPGSQETNNYYGIDVKTEFEIIKAPIQFSLNKELVPDSKIYFQISIGPQISYLTYYKSSLTHYDFDYVNKNIDFDFIINNIIRTPKYFEQSIWQVSPNPMYVQYSSEGDFLYNRWLFGMVGGVDFRKKIAEIFTIGFGGRVEYDITNSEKYPQRAFPGLGGVNTNTRSKSHNLRYGLTLTAMYLFY